MCWRTQHKQRDYSSFFASVALAFVVADWLQLPMNFPLVLAKSSSNERDVYFLPHIGFSRETFPRVLRITHFSSVPTKNYFEVHVYF